MKTIQKYIFTALSAVLATLAGNEVYAVPPVDTVAVNEKSLYDFESVRNSQLWNGSYNPAGLNFYNYKNISYVEAFFQKNNGSFVKYYESNNSFNFGVQTESFTRIKKVALYGKLGYRNFQGNKMTWSGLIYPEDHLINFADDIPADKRQESYFISGQAAFPVTDKLLAGIGLDYEASNLAKMRDLRHKTDFMDMKVKAGFIYTSEYINAGISYLYHRYNEKIKYSKVSSDLTVLNGYYFKGLWFGLSGSWDNPSLLLSGNKAMPFYEDKHGVSVQAELKWNCFSFLNEFSYQSQKGSMGIKGEQENSHSYGDIYEYSGKLHLESGRMNNILTVKTQYREDEQYDNVYRSQSIDNETVIVQFGSNKVYGRRIFTWNAEYNFTWGDRFNPSWDVRLGYENYAKSSVSSLVLPYYYTQEIKYNMGYVNARKNVVFGTGMLDVMLGVDYSNGYGIKLEEHKAENIQTDIAENQKPKPVETLLNKEYEYYTTPKIGGEIGARYSYFINKKKNKGGNVYLDAKYRLLSASEAVYAGGTKAHMFRIALGVNF